MDVEIDYHVQNQQIVDDVENGNIDKEIDSNLIDEHMDIVECMDQKVGMYSIHFAYISTNTIVPCSLFLFLIIRIRCS